MRRISNLRYMVLVSAILICFCMIPIKISAAADDSALAEVNETVGEEADSINDVGIVEADEEEADETETDDAEVDEAVTESADEESNNETEKETKNETCEEITIESEEILKVNIKNIYGESVFAKHDESLFTKDALIFSCENKKYLKGELTEHRDYYCLSYDKGNSYGDMIEISSDGLRLDCVTDNSEYYLKFMSVDNVKYLAEKTEENNPKEETESKKYIYHSEGIHIIFDKEAPVLSEIGTVAYEEWSGQSRTAAFKIEDKSSGLNRIYVKDDEGEILYECHDFAEGTNSVAHEFNVQLNKQAKDISGRFFTISAYDRAGNYFEKQYTYYYDNECPTISAEGVTNNEILNRDVLLTLKAFDNINTLTSIKYEIVPVMKGVVGKSKAKKITCIDDILAMTEVLGDNANYKVTAVAVDAAGNESETINLNFRIDKNAPVATIEGFKKGSDYKNNITARAIVEEEFYEDMKVNFKIIKRTPKEEKVIYEEDLMSNAERYSKEVVLYEEGDYSIWLSAVDAAGNETTSQSSLRIDKTAPSINVRGISNMDITKDVPQLLIDISDLFYDSLKAKILLYKKNDMELIETVSDIEPNITSENTSCPIAVYEEGEYILKVEASDRTGNLNTYVIEFSYDCSAPKVGWLDSIRRKYLKVFRLPEKFISMITDRNEITYNAFLNTEEISENTVITKDGKYVLRVIAIDKAGNVSDETAEFIIDNTAPRIVVTGLSKDGNVKKGSIIDFSLYDSEDYFEQVIYDGEEIDIAYDNKKCEFKIDKEGKHNIRLCAIDPAGNLTDRTFYVACNNNIIPMRRSEETKALDNVLAAPSESQSVKITKKFNEKYLYLFSAVILGISCAGVAFLLHLRRVDTDI